MFAKPSPAPLPSDQLDVLTFHEGMDVEPAPEVVDEVEAADEQGAASGFEVVDGGVGLDTLGVGVFQHLVGGVHEP